MLHNSLKTLEAVQRKTDQKNKYEILQTFIHQNEDKKEKTTSQKLYTFFLYIT